MPQQNKPIPSNLCVLLFPPVNNFRRFLIHQTCEQFRQQYDLFTFSVGQGPFRRTVVCFRNQLLDPNKFTDTAAAANFESRKKSPVKSWRSVERKTEVVANDISSTSSSSFVRQQRSTPGKMGAEKNANETRGKFEYSFACYKHLGTTV
ncbi:uncharacterized protein LOC118747161 [Rhagoletis pomonella]|uniref:uncharacterized protein LOC118747161 n=1 Tax=Rhagoletis pomonella TaxID=28610 RepID=UPI00177DE3B4|nr:uncharacterized protein LOC118747161 [Rhagoletis pomonella]